MSDVMYQCSVNKTHNRKVSSDSKAVPYCCGKPMTLHQVTTPATSTIKPQVQGTAPSATPAPSAAKPTQAQPQQQQTKTK